MDRKNDYRFNGSGYYDITPKDAIDNLENEKNDERYILSGKLVKIFQNIAHLSDFEIKGRIVLKDKKTGKTYK